MDISKWAFHNRNLIYFLIAVLMFGGAYSCYQMSKLEDPGFGTSGRVGGDRCIGK